MDWLFFRRRARIGRIVKFGVEAPLHVFRNGRALVAFLGIFKELAFRRRFLGFMGALVQSEELEVGSGQLGIQLFCFEKLGQRGLLSPFDRSTAARL